MDTISSVYWTMDCIESLLRSRDFVLNHLRPMEQLKMVRPRTCWHWETAATLVVGEVREASWFVLMWVKGVGNGVSWSNLSNAMPGCHHWRLGERYQSAADSKGSRRPSKADKDITGAQSLIIMHPEAFLRETVKQLIMMTKFYLESGCGLSFYWDGWRTLCIILRQEQFIFHDSVFLF